MGVSKSWNSLREKWFSQQQGAERLSVDAEHAISKGNFSGIRELLQDALTQDAENSLAQRLSKHLNEYQRAHELFKNAVETLDEAPGDAIRAFTEIKALSPYFEREIPRLIQRAEALLRKTLLSGSIQRAQEASSRSDQYLAITLIDEALLSLRSLEGFDPEIKTLLGYRSTFLELLDPIKSSAQGTGALNNLTLLLGTQIPVGRRSNLDGQIISCSYRRVSRADRQCLLEQSGSTINILARQSSNGTWLNQIAMVPGQKLPIPAGSSIISMGGTDHSEPGVCRLHLYQPSNHLGSVLVSFSTDHFVLLDLNLLRSQWENLDQEIARKWLLLNESFPIGIDETGSLDLGCQSSVVPHAFLLLDHGHLAIRPAKCDNPEDIAVWINEIPLRGQVPLVSGARVRIGHHVMGFIEETT